MKYRVDHIRRIDETLAVLPPVTADSKTCVTSKEAVGILADTLLGLRKKGYTNEMLANVLKEQGVVISVSTLRRYLKLAEDAKTTRGRKSMPPKTESSRKLPPSSSAAVAPQDRKVNADSDRTGTKGFKVRVDTDDL